MSRRTANERDAHLRCPQCSYDLHGIPEVRCPECGFGFDYAALRNLAELVEIKREMMARRVMSASFVGIAAAYLAVAVALDLPGDVALLIALVVYMLTFSGLVWSAGVYDGLRSVPVLILAAVAWMVVVLMFFMSPAGLIVATAVVAFGWVQRLVYWPRLYPPENSPRPDDRRYVTRVSLWATGLLIAATAFVGLGFKA